MSRFWSGPEQRIDRVLVTSCSVESSGAAMQGACELWRTAAASGSAVVHCRCLLAAENRSWKMFEHSRQHFRHNTLHAVVSLLGGFSASEAHQL